MPRGQPLAEVAVVTGSGQQACRKQLTQRRDADAGACVYQILKGAQRRRSEPRPLRGSSSLQKGWSGEQRAVGATG